ncbi:hypothetical protein [Pedobacter montanisoli]|uniref:Uncharacterized protein n=1 Tax=Pedobacter montanisoli TaxID=2923277 RepID=A0ABS9ZZC8_9SPHI|nr:hypothetical protein [Pedobacter montanisoli]MCJ0743630.1 hypothetical protein [Pedobacter montanisoli]
MILNIQKVKTRIVVLHSIPKSFFKKIEDSVNFGNHLFPNWSIQVFQNTDLQSKFKAVYDAYKLITIKNERDKIITAFQNSNEIERLCSNDPALEMLTINDIEASIRQPIKQLFSYLYNTASKYHEFTNFVNITVGKSIDEFIKHHKIEVCPICGLEGFLNLEGQARLALDHWLCQDIFPFSSVNFNNLIPIGGWCNSRPAKGDDNVLIDNVGNRKLAFYPYKNYNGINARFSFIEEPSFEEEYGSWEFIIEPKDNNEIDYFESWENTFNIKTRYNSFVKKNILTMWRNTYIEYIDDHDILNHASDLVSFKTNLQHWKSSFMKKKYVGYKAYRSFINHLVQNASDAYLTGIYQNILSEKGLI